MTPIDVCREYLELSNTTAPSRTINRKAARRRATELQDQYKSIELDSTEVAALIAIENDLAREESHYNYLDDFFENQIKTVRSILTNYGLVKEIDCGVFSLTPAGEFAARIGEIHPVIITHLLQNWHWLADFTPAEIIGFFSCFTDISIPDDERRVNPPEEVGARLKKCGMELRELHQIFYNMEATLEINTGFSYLDAVQFDLMLPAMQWARDCNTEEQCRAFLSETTAVSVGDFTKAMLKISNIARELAANCGETATEEVMNFVAKLSQVDELILKYVVTMQSLYI
jgi:hypothetical protein